MNLSYTLRPPPAPSLMYSLPVRRLRDILKHIVPGLTLTAVDEILSIRLPRFYTLNFSDSSQLLLSYAPPLSVRLLRDEQMLLQSEAMLLQLLVTILGPGDSIEAPSAGRFDAGLSPPGVRLRSLIPKLLKHSSNTQEICYQYSIFQPVVGVPLSTLSIYLNIPERQIIDKQIGELVRDLALITSPDGTFGGVGRVCIDPSRTGLSPRPKTVGGSSSWIDAFMSFVEGILRDGEDMSVLLPYAVIRQHFARLSWSLKAVTIPRLVVVDAGEESNLMVMRTFNDMPSSTEDSVRITGLRDWTQGIFGDPLLSSCFDTPSAAFMSGWKIEGEEDLIQDEQGSNTRILLYKCYRAIVKIVTAYYRPQADSSRSELEARRNLTTLLADLEKEDTESSNVTKRSRTEPDSEQAF